MWSVSPATRIFVARGATDMRMGFNGLYARVKLALERDPMSGHLFVFCNRRRTRLKILYWDGSGLWVCAKRLERGRFTWPEKGELTSGELGMLVGGLELNRAREKKWHRV
ncbi:MAG: IS66 family insertion sequence element accessory protein TnpB [Verrucomicrobiae bacterium]|nr:IS66 family insertion sequence element accessory protein TnpB [Verrucomicrobiae bacterium]